MHGAFSHRYYNKGSEVGLVSVVYVSLFACISAFVNSFLRKKDGANNGSLK